MNIIPTLCQHIVAAVAATLISGTAFATKAEGPFAIDAKISGPHVTVTITTTAPAKNLELQLYGSDGLEVKDAVQSGPLKVKTIKRATLSKGESWTVEADFVQPAGLSHLQVWVGSSGQPSVVRSFAVGELSAQQKADRNQGVRLDPEGQPIRISE